MSNSRGPELETLIPDRFDPIVGNRLWRWDRREAGWRLRSFYTNVTWPVNHPLVAYCNQYTGLTEKRWKRRHRESGGIEERICPIVGCTCGIYALKDTWWPGGIMPGKRAGSDHYAYGRVALWGTVQIHQYGYRAQFAYPIDVHLDQATFTDVESARTASTALAEAYGIEVTVEPFSTYTSEVFENLKPRYVLNHGEIRWLVGNLSAAELLDEWVVE